MYNSAGIVFTGSYGNQCAYFSKAGKCIIRAKSSLTGARVSKDPAFAGFRKSGNRMKEASPIAAELYNLIPKGQKEYGLYRSLTGEALKMIKAGISKKTIIKKLKETYINPILNPPAKKQAKIQIRKSRIKRYADSAGAQNANAVVRSLRPSRRQDADSLKRYAETLLRQASNNHMASPLHKISPSRTESLSGTASPSGMESLSGMGSLSRIKPSMSLRPTRNSAPSGPIYLGREKKFRKFKMWLMPDAEFTSTDMRKITELLLKIP